MRNISIAALAGLALLAGCGKKPDDENRFNESVNQVQEEPAPTPVIETPPPQDNAATQESKAPPPRISEEQQIQEDADATGMTSRLPEEDGFAPSTASDSASSGAGNASARR